jgi:superfamily II DNA helicase RecQ
LTDNQSRSITAIIDGKDIFVGTKTGSGKSLIYEAIPKWRSVLKSSQFQEKMKAIVVDEAHTVIRW